MMNDGGVNKNYKMKKKIGISFSTTNFHYYWTGSQRKTWAMILS